MKIEKVNDNQIRCTLTREDLDSRHIKLSELAYGTEKAKSLFRELMEQAAYEHGFDAEDIPLMIEAVPLSGDSILLIVTKVEYPEELDARFSHFSEEADLGDVGDFADLLTPDSPAAQDIVDMFNRARNVASTIGQIIDDDKSESTVSVPVDITKLFVFQSLEDVIRLTRVLGDFYHGHNTLYKNPKDGRYYLVVSKSDHTTEEFNKTCNIISEYGSQGDFSVGQGLYFEEHYNKLVAEQAIATLATL